MPPPTRETPAPVRFAEPWLDRAAGWSFLLLVAASPWSIAPMSITAGLCGALTLLLWWRRPGQLPGTPVAWPTLAWLAALLLSAAFALDRSASLPRVTKGLFPLLVPLAATHARLPGRGRRALAVLLVSATLAALFGLGLYLAKGATWPARARGAVGHPVVFGHQLLLFVSLAAGIAALARAPRWRLGALLAGLAGCAALAATFTRSAWIGLAVALATLFGLARPRWLPALAVALVLAVALAPPAYRARALSAFQPHDAGNLERTYMWRGGLAMFRDHPLTGVGLEDLKPIYDRYMPPQAQERAGHLHSVPIQIAATMGVVGLVAFVLLYGSLFVAAARGLGGTLARGGPAAGLRAGVVALLAGFLVAGLFEWNLGHEALLYPLFTLVGMAWAARDWDAGEPGAGSPPAPSAPAPLAATPARDAGPR
jgi:O-antigen ligase